MRKLSTAASRTRSTARAITPSQGPNPGGLTSALWRANQVLEPIGLGFAENAPELCDFGVQFGLLPEPGRGAKNTLREIEAIATKLEAMPPADLQDLARRFRFASEVLPPISPASHSVPQPAANSSKIMSSFVTNNLPQKSAAAKQPGSAISPAISAAPPPSKIEIPLYAQPVEAVDGDPADVPALLLELEFRRDPQRRLMVIKEFIARYRVSSRVYALCTFDEILCFMFWAPDAETRQEALFVRAARREGTARN